MCAFTLRQVSLRATPPSLSPDSIRSLPRSTPFLGSMRHPAFLPQLRWLHCTTFLCLSTLHSAHCFSLRTPTPRPSPSPSSTPQPPSPRRSAAPLAMRMPEELVSLLPVAVRRTPEYRAAAEENWEAFRLCFDAEPAALDAARRCLAVILPYGFDAPRRAANIAGSYAALREMLGDEAELRAVLAKNPGVLGCQPQGLRASDAATIRRAASVAAGVSQLLAPARGFLLGTTWWDEDKSKEEAEVLQLPELVVDGRAFLYDKYGEYNGVEHLLLTEEGEPWGVWDPEAEVAEECEFEEEDED